MKPSTAGPHGVDARGDASQARARFEALVAEHLDGLYRTGLRLTRSPSAAEDLVQEAMLRAWRSFHTFHEGTNIRAWLYRILVNAHFDRHRKETREPVVVPEDVSDVYIYTKAQKLAA
jgi:RNA polymerase sigma-70 factor (ECF subfamily)